MDIVVEGDERYLHVTWKLIHYINSHMKSHSSSGLTFAFMLILLKKDVKCTKNTVSC